MSGPWRGRGTGRVRDFFCRNTQDAEDWVILCGGVVWSFSFTHHITLRNSKAVDVQDVLLIQAANRKSDGVLGSEKKEDMG